MIYLQRINKTIESTLVKATQFNRKQKLTHVTEILVCTRLCAHTSEHSQHIRCSHAIKVGSENMTKQKFVNYTNNKV